MINMSNLYNGIKIFKLYHRCQILILNHIWIKCLFHRFLFLVMHALIYKEHTYIMGCARFFRWRWWDGCGCMPQSWRIIAHEHIFENIGAYELLPYEPQCVGSVCGQFRWPDYYDEHLLCSCWQTVAEFHCSWLLSSTVFFNFFLIWDEDDFPNYLLIGCFLKFIFVDFFAEEWWRGGARSRWWSKWTFNLWLW